MTKLLSIAAILPATLVAVAHAQPALDALEQKVRRDVAAENAQPAEPQPAEPAVNSQQPQQKPRQGYAGLVVDDRDDRGRGVRILEVAPKGPGGAAGLRPQDLITGLGGVRVRQLSDMIMILEQVPPGGSLEFEVLRGTEPKRINVTFARWPVPTPASTNATPEPPQPQPPSGQATEPPSIEALLRRIEQLEQRVQALEQALKARDAQPK